MSHNSVNYYLADYIKKNKKNGILKILEKNQISKNNQNNDFRNRSAPCVFLLDQYFKHYDNIQTYCSKSKKDSQSHDLFFSAIEQKAIKELYYLLNCLCYSTIDYNNLKQNQEILQFKHYQLDKELDYSVIKDNQLFNFKNKMNQLKNQNIFMFPEQIKAYCDLGFNPNASFILGQTMGHFFINNQKINGNENPEQKTIQAVIVHQESINNNQEKRQQHNNNQNNQSYVSGQGQIDIDTIQELEQKGVNFCIQDDYGLTPMHYLMTKDNGIISKQALYYLIETYQHSIPKIHKQYLNQMFKQSNSDFYIKSNPVHYLEYTKHYAINNLSDILAPNTLDKELFLYHILYWHLNQNNLSKQNIQQFFNNSVESMSPVSRGPLNDIKNQRIYHLSCFIKAIADHGLHKIEFLIHCLNANFFNNKNNLQPVENQYYLLDQLIEVGFFEPMDSIKFNFLKAINNQHKFMVSFNQHCTDYNITTQSKIEHILLKYNNQNSNEKTNTGIL